MGHIVGDFLPLIVGAAVDPFYAIVVLLLLQGKGGLLKATAKEHA